MASNSWGTIEELYFRGLHASDSVRRQLLSQVPDPHIVAAVEQLWINAVEAPSGFLRDRPESEAEAFYKARDIVEGRFQLDTLLGTGGMARSSAPSTCDSTDLLH
jgi:hypothetical protein